MIQPINNHLLIEPLKQDGDFIVSSVDHYQEVGVVIDKAATVLDIKIGDKVYFDAWLAAKFPKVGSTDEHYWLVKYEDVRAIENVQQ